MPKSILGDASDSGVMDLGSISPGELDERALSTEGTRSAVALENKKSIENGLNLRLIG